MTKMLFISDTWSPRENSTYINDLSKLRFTKPVCQRGHHVGTDRR